MAKSKDSFEAFKNSALSGPSISSALSAVSPTPSVDPAGSGAVNPAAPQTTAPSPIDINEPKQKKGANEEQVAFFIDKEVKRKFGMLKYELGVQYKDLYNEAITDLLKKYGKL